MLLHAPLTRCLLPMLVWQGITKERMIDAARLPGGFQARWNETEPLSDRTALSNLA